jgi:hypothetical protein
LAKDTVIDHACVAHAAPLHNCRYRWLRAPATNLGPGTSSPDPLHILSRGPLCPAPFVCSASLPLASIVRRRTCVQFAALWFAQSASSHVSRLQNDEGES